jgi:hypothetical protein
VVVRLCTHKPENKKGGYDTINAAGTGHGRTRGSTSPGVVSLTIDTGTLVLGGTAKSMHGQGERNKHAETKGIEKTTPASCAPDDLSHVTLQITCSLLLLVSAGTRCTVVA